MKETFSAWSVLGLHNEGKQFSGWLSELRAAAMTSEKLVAEAEDSSGTQRKGERPPLQAATKQQLVKTEKTLCVL